MDTQLNPATCAGCNNYFCEEDMIVVGDALICSRCIFLFKWDDDQKSFNYTFDED